MTTPSTTWDPQQYDRYADERTRPFRDLVDRIGATAPGVVVDLGCGSGRLTASLAQRWPTAEIEGVDSSPEMLRDAPPSDRVRLRQGDIVDWTPDRPVDVLLSNAALQWVPGHVDLFERFVAALAPAGWFAFQVPGNFRSPSHTLLADLRESSRWRDRLGEGARRAGSLDPADYLDRLATLGCTVDAWETTYLHVLPGDDAVLQWVKGSALRPVYDRLGPAEAAEFEADYGRLLREAYPRHEYGTVFPFRRVFVAAHR